MMENTIETKRLIQKRNYKLFTWQFFFRGSNMPKEF